MSNSITRRSFVTGAGAAVAASALAPAALVAEATTPAKPASQPVRKLNIGIVGCAHRGFDHVKEIHAIPNANVVALCDVDANHLVKGARHIISAKTYVDFREMLKHPEVEAVVVSTPDHTHAHITAAALRAGKHVYCEKPLTHTIAEARAITDLAKQTKRVTQMGIQIHAKENYRRVVELVQAGAIGAVSEVHCWNNRTNRTANFVDAPVPSTLNYDLWLGPLPTMPFKKDYHPYNWRRYWAFGEGMLGDIGCHLMDIAFWALDLKYPTRVSAEGGPKLDDAITAEWIVATYDFPARGADKPPVKMTWYDPPKTPPMLSQWNLPPNLAGEGVMFIGEGGRMLFTNYGEHALLPQVTFANYTRPPQTIGKSPGHQAEWIDACLKDDPTGTSTPFSYAGPLTETALLGTIAYRAQKSLEWDAVRMTFANAPDAEKLLSREYRAGWTL